MDYIAKSLSGRNPEGTWMTWRKHRILFATRQAAKEAGYISVDFATTDNVPHVQFDRDCVISQVHAQLGWRESFERCMEDICPSKCHVSQP